MLHESPAALDAPSTALAFLAKLEQANQTHEYRIGMDYHENVLSYGLPLDDGIHFLVTGRKTLSVKEDAIKTSGGSVHGFPISPDGMTRYLNGEEVDGTRLLGELEAFFATHAKFQNDDIPFALALWVMAGYMYMAFPNFGYVAVTSPQRGCGKSRVLELIQAVAFRASSIVNPTPAVVFRSLHAEANVLIIDEFEKSGEDTKSALLAILNAGFARGQQVQRCTGEKFELERFHVYGPKVFAGLDELPDTLASRTMRIVMHPKTKSDKILPFSPVTMAGTLQKWKDDLGIWALNNAPKVVAATLDRAALLMPEALDDRATDYMVPLFAVNACLGDDRAKLLSFCEGLVETRTSQASDCDYPRAVSVLEDWLGERESAVLKVSEAAQLFAHGGVLEGPNPRKAGSMLRMLGLNVKDIRIGEGTAKAAQLSRQQVGELVARFPKTA